MSKLRSPIVWFGGKGKMVAKLLKYVPEHHVYVEVFGGGASLLMGKEPAPVEVYNDVHSGVVNLFRVLRNPAQFQEFYRQVSLIPHSREEFYDCDATWEEVQDPVQKAVGFFVRQRQSFSGHHSWGYVVSESRYGMAKQTSTWFSIIDMLPEIHQRLFRCQIEHDDFRAVIPRYDNPSTFFYCDPPYVTSTRKAGDYKHEMTNTEHRALVGLLLNVQGMVLLSGYNSRLYQPIEQAGWTRQDHETACYAAARTRQTGIQGKGSAMSKQPRTESLWLNPALQKALHTRARRGK